ncbi:MAG: GNAT family N-acetyltransferase [Clostridia bacterium]|nr:GNAT family N-acetyltransferase [Clostridia bacterium]
MLVKEEMNNQNNQMRYMEKYKDRVVVRRAQEKDLEGIFNVALSVGKAKKASYDGFLMDNYEHNPEHFKKVFLRNIRTLKFFYVAQSKGEILGFIMAYTAEEWLQHQPDWAENIMWKPGFKVYQYENFVLTDKIAVRSDLRGCGIGSKMYRKYIEDLKMSSVNHIFSETIIDPVPNFASLSFRKKQHFKLAGIRYEKYKGKIYTDLIYYKPVYREIVSKNKLAAND